MNELNQAKKVVNDKRGEGKIILGSQTPNSLYIPTEIFLLDRATLGGPHDGRGTMIYGVEGSGKSTLGYRIMAGCQRKYAGSHVVLLDLEHMFERQWFEKCGGDPERLELIQPDFAEEGIDMAISLIDSKEVSGFMIDSIASLVPKKMDERSVEDYGTGERARLAGLLCSKILNSWSRERERGHRCTVVMVNQYRDDIGKMVGDPRKLPGGWQVNYFCKTRIQMKSRKKFINAKGEINDSNSGTPHHNLHTFEIRLNVVAPIVNQVSR